MEFFVCLKARGDIFIEIQEKFDKILRQKIDFEKVFFRENFW